MIKLDKLSNRLSKVQADNQLRFQQLENKTLINDYSRVLLSKSIYTTALRAIAGQAGAIGHSKND